MMKKKNKKRSYVGWIVLGVILLLLLVWWFSCAPVDDIQITGKLVLNENETVLEKQDDAEPLANALTTVCENMPGYDEFLPLPGKNSAVVTCLDGWIWKIDMNTWTAERFVDAPLVAAGAVLDPLDDNSVYFCSSYFYNETYPKDEIPGIYRLDLTTKELTSVINRVPMYPYSDFVDINGPYGSVWANGEYSMKRSELTEENSMTAAFCNDLAISRDGQRIYWSEPFGYEGAAFGGGMEVYETISLGQHGRIWCYDMENDSVSLVGDGIVFADGLLLEYENESDMKESSILITETIKYSIVRLHLTGERSGAAEVLWSDLPGMPDGLSYNENGEIWLGLLHARSGILDFVYANPWAKHILLRLPVGLFSASEGCGVIAFNADCSEVLYFTLYTGDNINSISAAVESNGKIFLASFDKEQRGLHYIENPLNAH